MVGAERRTVEAVGRGIEAVARGKERQKRVQRNRRRYRSSWGTALRRRRKGRPREERERGSAAPKAS